MFSVSVYVCVCVWVYFWHFNLVLMLYWIVWNITLLTFKLRTNAKLNWLGGCFVLWRINPFRVIKRRIKFQTLQFSKSIVFVYRQLNVKTVLLQIIQFSISTQCSLFGPLRGPYQVLPSRARVDLREMAMKRYSALLKGPALLEPHHQIV